MKTESFYEGLCELLPGVIIIAVSIFILWLLSLLCQSII